MNYTLTADFFTVIHLNPPLLGQYLFSNYRGAGPIAQAGSGGAQKV